MEASIQAALDVPSILERKRIPQTAIESVVAQIAEKYRPLRIILFGSYAYGTPRRESDVDLLVVMETALGELGQAAQICQNIQYRFGLDLVVITPARLAQRLEWGDSFLREITSRGIVFYESTGA